MLGLAGRQKAAPALVPPATPPNVLLTQPAAWCHPLRHHPKSGDTPGSWPSSLPVRSQNPIAAPGLAGTRLFILPEGDLWTMQSTGRVQAGILPSGSPLGLGDFWDGRTRARGSAPGGSTLRCLLLVPGCLVSSSSSLRPRHACPQSISTSIPMLTPHRCRPSSVEERPARRLPASSQLN